MLNSAHALPAEMDHGVKIVPKVSETIDLWASLHIVSRVFATSTLRCVIQ